MSRHYEYSSRQLPPPQSAPPPPPPQRPRNPQLSFGTILLSLVHSGPEYLDDLAERLAEKMAGEAVEEHISRLHGIGESLSGSGVDQAVEAEFMRIFNEALSAEGGW